MDTHLSKFLKTQRLVAIASVDHEGKPWLANVYYSITKEGDFFFVSPPDTRHSVFIKGNPTIAFTVAWFNSQDYGDRVAVQGIGTCTQLHNPVQIGALLLNHYQYYPLWKEIITERAMREKLIESRPYLIKPTYIKFWNDKLYGEEGTREFHSPKFE